MKKIAADNNYRMLRKNAQESKGISEKDVEIKAFKLALEDGWTQGSFNHWVLGEEKADKSTLIDLYKEQAKEQLLEQEAWQYPPLKQKEAADRYYRLRGISKSADIGERVLDTPLANPPHMPTEEQIRGGAFEMACEDLGPELANTRWVEYLEKSEAFFMQHGKPYHYGLCYN